MNDFYPLGTVVRLKSDEGYLMIVGRVVSDGEGLYDYAGCIFPLGVQGEEYFMFDNEDIEEVTFVGYQDERELVFRRALMDSLAAIAEEE